jgi:(p)ppGpp synthase/HD superfamily hydrolase
LHATQNRKETNIPYLSHLMAVASLAMEYGATEDEAIAALLHDAVEDQGGEPTRLEIQKRFGDNVARIVKECSDTDKVPKPPWRERKIAYIEGLRNHDNSTLLVSACDKLHNVRSITTDYHRIGDTVFDRFTGGKDGTLWYYRWLAETFQELGPPQVAADLERAVTELERLAAGGRQASTFGK